MIHSNYKRDNRTLDRRINDLIPGRDVHFIYKYALGDTVVNAQKLDDTEETPPLEKNLQVIKVHVEHQHPLHIPITRGDVPLALHSWLRKMNSAYGTAALVRVINPYGDCKSGAAPERKQKDVSERRIEVYP